MSGYKCFCSASCRSHCTNCLQEVEIRKCLPCCFCLPSETIFSSKPELNKLNSELLATASTENIICPLTMSPTALFGDLFHLLQIRKTVQLYNNHITLLLYFVRISSFVLHHLVILSLQRIFHLDYGLEVHLKWKFIRKGEMNVAIILFSVFFVRLLN